MYDTVRLFICQALPPGTLQGIGATCEQQVNHSTGEVKVKWHLNDGPLHLTYHPNTVERPPLVLVESSIVKLLCGDNVTMLWDARPALDKLGAVVDGRVPGLPPVEEWGVSRFDACMNVRMAGEEQCQAYVLSLARQRIARHKTITWFDESVEFMTKAHSHKHYRKSVEYFSKDKGGSLTHDQVDGVYRMETRLEGADTIRRRLKLRQGAGVLEVLQPENSLRLLRGDLASLGLGVRLLAGDSYLLQLVHAFGPDDAADLYGFVYLLHLVGGRDNLLAMGYGRAKYYRLVKRLKDAGFSLTLPEGEAELPLLRLPDLADLADLVTPDGIIPPDRIPEL